MRERRGALEADGAAGQDPEGLGAVLVAALEQQLEAEADAEERAIRRDPGADRLDEAAVAQPVHRGSGRADARHDAAGPGRRCRSPVTARWTRAPAVVERLLDRDEVAGAVVDDGDARSAGGHIRHPSDPFVDATPVRRGSGSHATRSARPSALNAASARWWSLRPGAAQVERGAGGPRERLEGVVDELERQRPGALGPERQVDHRVRPAADVDDGRRDGLVHRHGAVAEAADPGPVAERLREGRAEHEGDVLDRVVLVDLQVAGRPDLEVEQAVVGQRAQEVVVEADPGLDVGAARAVEVERDRDVGLAGAARDADAAALALE